ncbi:hypothetical protein RclHR1_00400027 [Rhizophagus clarus]|uniref:Uncharacterized protein n=1 Tax=Rhizophagus clarus TaxID=94130 RepID=A0A2Z6RIF1_9GLOM|nr:hypothetical protein RclHR1_00400027 [Rhizophagus clarus]GES87248.1 hypothetical protein GLOIN_2v1869728 [Rhizophagus clarus]
MDGSSNQSGSSSGIAAYKMILHENIYNNRILLKLEEDEFITPDEKAEQLLKNLTKPKHLYALKLLFENSQNVFSPQILRDALVALADPTPFDYYAKQSIVRLELHLRTWVAVLEQVCFTEMRLSKELRDRIYNSLPKFAEIHRKTTQVMQEGIDNKYTSNFDQFNQFQISKDDVIIKKRNYNIDFLLIHLRDTLHSLRDDETWFQEIVRRTKDLLKVSLNITPGILSITGVTLPALPKDNNCSILSMLTQVRQSLSFKYPVASYYIDWRIMLIVQHNIFLWSESPEMIISTKFGELILMEYIWSFLEREWINVENKSILNSQTKFDDVSDKVIKALKNTGSILNDLAGNEPLALPHTLWFGILDLAQNLIQKSTRIATYGLCYYLAIESLNKAPSNFIQFKAIEILLYLQNIDNQEFSMIEIDFDQYAKKLNENKPLDFSEKFQSLLTFVKEKYLEDLKILDDDIRKGIKGKGKEKSLNQNLYLIREKKSTSKILDVIASEMTCPISSEPTDQLCILKCQHALSLSNLKKLKQKKCPECREKIENDDIRYLPQNSIYKNLYSKFFESGYILPSIKLDDSSQIIDNQYDSDDDSNNSEVDLILTKKNKFRNSIKLNSNISLQSIFPRISKKQHPMYQNAIKELNEKNYEKAEYFCKEFLRTFSTNYTMRCILAYIYRCLNNYEQAHLYLKEAINLNEKKPIAYFIRGEIFFRQSNYDEAIYYLNKSLEYKVKVNNLYVILGNSNLFEAESYHYDEYYYDYYLSDALKNYSIALQNNPNSYSCLKNSAYIYEKREDYSNALKMLDKLLIINKDDSLILCYYGEILYNMKKFNDAILYFTKASIIDPENIHNLNKRAIAYFNAKEYEKSLFDFNKIIQLNPLNTIAYYYKKSNYFMELNRLSFKYRSLPCYTYYKIKTMDNVMIDSMGLDLDFWLNLYEPHKMDNNNFNDLGIINKFNKYMYKVYRIYFLSNLINLDNKYLKFKENDPNSLTGYILAFKNEKFDLSLPQFSGFFDNDVHYCLVLKINIKNLSSDNCFVNFVIINNENRNNKLEHTLKYKDLSYYNLLGWIEYKLPYKWKYSYWIQLSIELDGFTDLQIDYIQFVQIQYEYEEQYDEEQSKINNILTPDYKNIPEAFRDKFFSRKEMDNLLELKDII